MNRQIRIVALIALVLFVAVFLNVGWVQWVDAQHLAANPNNVRVLLKAYASERGPMLSSDHQELAKSVPTNDPLKYLRTYPQSTAFAQLTGYDSLIYGTSALEHALNTQLTGAAGRLSMQDLNDHLFGTNQPGDTVLLTLSNTLQHVAVAALGNRKGAVVALNPTNGAILAMVSSPSYDPNRLSSHNTTDMTAYWKSLQTDPTAPMLNRANGQTYPPGSTFKVITAVSALQNGFTLSQTYAPATQYLPQQTNQPISNFGKPPENCGGDMLAAFTVSCNTYFAQLGASLPKGALATTAQGFGFTSPLPVEIPGAISRVPSQGDLKSPAFAAQSAIGQYNVAATPLQMALVASAVAYGGKIMTPHLVDHILDPSGATIQTTTPSVWKTAMDPSIAAQMTTLMESVVNSGTGTPAQIPGVRVAGKTGTAQNAPGQAPHAWFIGFAPANAPQIAVAVLVENGGNAGSEATGGKVSAPIAQQVMMAARPIQGW